jgi:dihydropteroate synthase
MVLPHSPQLYSPAERFPARAAAWRLRNCTFTFAARPLVMGIVNVTPDSFSDGGVFLDPSAALDHALELVAEGADILDIGGESTRPYAEPVSEREELRRIVPVLERLIGQAGVPISIDTSKAAVARAALELGAEIINDVTGLEGDPRMVETAREFSAGVCAMHMQGTPRTMQDAPSYENVVEEIHDYLKRRKEALEAAGIEPARICLDPGIGFGKTHEHNLTLAANCHRFHDLGCPLLVGHSRKGFIAHVLGDKGTNRLYGTIGVALSLAVQGVQVIRVHDVRPVREALTLFEACGGFDGIKTQGPSKTA